MHKILRSHYLHHFIFHLTSIQSDNPSKVLVNTQFLIFPALFRIRALQTQHLKELLSCDAELAEHRKAGGASDRAPLPPAIFHSGSLTSWSSNWLRIAIRAVWTKDSQLHRNWPRLARRVSKSKPFHCIRSIRITSSLPACYSSMMARSIESISSSWLWTSELWRTLLPWSQSVQVNSQTAIISRLAHFCPTCRSLSSLKWEDCTICHWIAILPRTNWSHPSVSCWSRADWISTMIYTC